MSTLTQVLFQSAGFFSQFILAGIFCFRVCHYSVDMESSVNSNNYKLISIRTLFIRKMKGTLGYHVGIIRKEDWQHFDGILCDVHEKYKQDRALRNTTAHWSGPQ